MDCIEFLSNSGWVASESIAETLTECGIPVPDRNYLAQAFDASVWDETGEACALLKAHFKDCRYADTAVYGPLLVPNPKRFDVRSMLSGHIRNSQPEITVPDFVDERLPSGADHTFASSDWTLFAALVSEAGISMGSYNDIIKCHDCVYTVNGYDTRQLMIRQLWCSLVLQSPLVPDSELRTGWTFSLFAGEDPVDGSVVSGTVLHGQVRQRLGKATRGSAPARVRPALRIAGSRQISTL